LNGEIRTVIANSNQLVFSSVPCGSSVVFVSVPRAGTPSAKLWRADANGGNLNQLTSGTDDIMPTCSPDGKSVFYLSSGAPVQLMRVPVTGGTPHKVGDLDGYRRIDVSPDGKLLAMTGFSLDQHKANIRLMDAESGKSVSILSPRAQPDFTVRFSPDGKSVAYSVTENGVGNLWVQPLDGGPPRPLTSFHSELIRDFQWSPNGKKLALIRGHTDLDLLLLTDTSR
jgi:Tol biopolymer transport system component